LAPWTATVLHDHLIDKIDAGETSPGTNMVMLTAAQYIEGIEWIDRIDRMHEPFTAPTGYLIHVVASS
jgi:malonyl CoA-acyl carrier protein transacylase